MPRQLITDQQEEPDDLPALTPQQQEFVRHILGGKSASDAYREAYDTSSMKQNTVWAEASRLRNNPSVAAWLAAARKANLGVAVLTKEAHLQELERLRELAVEKGNLGAAVQAEQIRGKVAGHQVDRIQEVPADADDPHKTLDKIAAEQGADKAIQLAQIAGITTWQPQTDTRH